jgi:hypothetical protein
MKINHQMMQQTQQDMMSLSKALNSGNVSTAQSSLSTFQQDFSAFSQMFNSASTSTGQPDGVQSTMAAPQADLSTLNSDLSSGNLPAAQQELAKFKSDLHSAMQSYRQSRLTANLNSYMSGGGLAQQTAALMPSSTSGALLNVMA